MTDPRNRLDSDLYRRVVEQTRDYAVFVLDPKGCIRSWNLGAERIKGYAPEEIIGRHFSTFYMQEAIDRGWPQHELQVATQEGRFGDEEERLVRPAIEAARARLAAGGARAEKYGPHRPHVG